MTIPTASERDDIATPVCSGQRFWRGSNSLWSDVEYPRQHKRNGKPDQQQHDYHADHRARNFKKWKNLSETLRERPARNDVGDRHTIDFAPLQFLEKPLILTWTDRDDNLALPIDRQMGARTGASGAERA